MSDESCALCTVFALQNKPPHVPPLSINTLLIINYRPLGDRTECDLYASASLGQNVTFAYYFWQVSQPQ